MNIIVLIKQVPDTETKVRITADKRSIETNDIKWVINPYDEFAIEEGLKTKERLKEGTVTVVTVGPDRTVEALRTAVAMGADNAVHVKVDTTPDTYLVSKALAEVCKKENGQIIFTTAPPNTGSNNIEVVYLGGAVVTTPYLSADNYGVIRINPSVLTTNATITTGYHGSAAGPLTVANNITLTIANNSSFVVY